MAQKPAGNEWLKAHFLFKDYAFTHSSYINHNESIELTSKGNVEQTYGQRYAPVVASPMLHLEFALKYDDVSLDFLQAVFKKVSKEEVTSYVANTPGGRYSRKIGFLYEFLTGNKLSVKNTSGNYVDLLDPDKYVTGKIIRNPRWRINDNLLGTAEYCPVVRRTKTLQSLLQKDVRKGMKELINNYPEDIFKRATSYLYNKETSSSYEIEKEKPSPDRIGKFIALLSQAGAQSTIDVLARKNLIQLQNIIVDPRFVATDFRDFQNYVGESLPNAQTLLHFICPPPAILLSLMEGLKGCGNRISEVDARIKAAIISFGFVFIHPFEDGNGRLHRFLIHDVLVHDGLVRDGLIIPVSAHMLNDMKAYDQILEAYSKPLMQRTKYETNDNGEVRVTNQDDISGYFRYPDLTAQCIYLIETIHATLKDDMPAELLFIQRYDEAKKELQNIVDMPDREINLMLIYLHQNKGIFPNRRRDKFSKLTDDEITRMQLAYGKAFEI